MSTATDLARDLAARRELGEVRRADTLARREGRGRYRRALADIADTARDASRARKARARDASGQEALATLYREARYAGERARVRVHIHGSAEARALRLEHVRAGTLRVGVPVVAACAAWSTSGVHAGVVRTLEITPGSTGWWAAWAVEPALMTVVVMIIVVRATLAACGGRADWRASVIEWLALSASIVLNAAAAADWGSIPVVVARSVGPLGAAGAAYLVGLILKYCADARPWEGAHSLRGDDAQELRTAQQGAHEGAQELRTAQQGAQELRTAQQGAQEGAQSLRTAQQGAHEGARSLRTAQQGAQEGAQLRSITLPATAGEPCAHCTGGDSAARLACAVADEASWPSTRRRAAHHGVPESSLRMALKRQSAVVA